jgi:hypothetical protein
MGYCTKEGVNSKKISFWLNVCWGYKWVGRNEVVWFSEQVWCKEV